MICYVPLHWLGRAWVNEGAGKYPKTNFVVGVLEPSGNGAVV